MSICVIMRDHIESRFREKNKLFVKTNSDHVIGYIMKVL